MILVSAGGIGSFEASATLIFRAGLATVYCHGQIKGENFTKWMLEKLLPNIPCQNVIVLDNVSYHSIQENQALFEVCCETENDQVQK